MMSQGQTPKETHILQKKDVNKMGHYAAHLMNLMTLPKEDQAMIHIKTKKERIVSRDETKVMITCNHTQCVAV